MALNPIDVGEDLKHRSVGKRAFGTDTEPADLVIRIPLGRSEILRKDVLDAFWRDTRTKVPDTEVAYSIGQGVLSGDFNLDQLSGTSLYVSVDSIGYDLTDDRPILVLVYRVAHQLC